MLNKDNQITVGSKRKREFRAMLTSFVLDTKNGTKWDLYDIQVMEGLRNYYRSVEKDTIDGIIKSLGEKYRVDIVRLIKSEMNPT